MPKTRPLKRAQGEDGTPDLIFAQSARRRMLIGAQRGLKVVTVFYMVTLVGFGITLGHLFDHRSFGVIDVAFMYFSWGLFGGAFGGLTVPMARGPISSIPVVASIFLPLMIAVRVMDAGWSSLSSDDLLFVPIASIFMGLLWGPLAWWQINKDES